MEDMKHPVNELRNAIKIEAMEWSQESEAMEIFTGRTFTFFVENDVQSSKKGMHSRSKMDDVEQDFTNALRNVMKMEKIDSSIYSETEEISSTGRTFEEEESQKIMVNQNPEMTFNQDRYRHATNSCCKDGYSENLKDEHFSYCNKKYQLVYAEKKSYLFQIGTETFSSSKIKNEMIYLGKKQFTCKICQKRFPYPSYLKNHERIHTNERPFKCNICQKGFNHSSNLACHKKIHSGRKPFLCTFCQKAFTESCHLKSHELIHSG